MLKSRYRYQLLEPSSPGTKITSNFDEQNLCEELEAQEVQAEAALKEVGLVSSVASPQVMEALSVDCSRLREAISHTKDLVHLKRAERDKGLIQVLRGERSPCFLVEETVDDIISDGLLLVQMDGSPSSDGSRTCSCLSMNALRIQKAGQMWRCTCRGWL